MNAPHRKLAAPALALALATLLSLAAGCSSEKTCASDQRLCSNSCVALQSDAQNCGACGNVCGSGKGCQSGACVDCVASPGACTAEVVAACLDTDDVRPLAADLTASTKPITTPAPGNFALLSGQLYVASNGGASVSSIDSSKATASVVAQIAGASDIEHLGSFAGLLYLSDATANTLTAVDVAQGKVFASVPLAAADSPSPAGFDFAARKAYVALAPKFGSTSPNALAVVDLSAAPTAIPAPHRIDLSSYAAAGALARPSRVLASADGKRIFVTLSDLDASYGAVTGANGRLVVIDTATDAVVGTVTDLGSACLDPSGMTLDGSILWVACGFYDYIGNKGVVGGGLLPVDVSGTSPKVGVAITTGNVLGSIALCDGFIYAGATESGTVVKVDPGTGKVVASSKVCPLGSFGSAYVPDLSCAR